MNAAERIEIGMKNGTQEVRIALLEQSISHIHESLLRIERKLQVAEKGIKNIF